MATMTEPDRTYNGWTNYETWNVALWIGNEQGSYEYWEKEQAEECYRDAVEADEDGDRQAWTDDATERLAARLETEFTDNQPELSGCYADILNAAMSEVNWHEIAENYIGELDHDEIEKDILPQPDGE